MRRIEVTALVIVGALFFVWPLAHTVALRALLQFVAITLVGWLAYRSRPHAWFLELRVPLTLYAALLAWLLLVALFISPSVAEALDEMRGHWLKSGGALLLGAWFAGSLASHETERVRVFTILTAILVGHALYVDLLALLGTTSDGIPRRQHTIGFGGPDKASYQVNILFAFLFVAVWQRLTGARGILPIGNIALGVCVLVAAFGSYVTGVRNGLVELVAMCAVAVAALVVVRDEFRWRTFWPATIGLLAILAMSMAFSVKHDTRWNSLFESTRIAWDTDTHRAWLDVGQQPLPRLANGATVDQSAYLRVAWWKEGLALVAENPLGLGVSRNAFGRGLTAKYGDNAANHSHSGLLDVALAGGFPAALLWLAFLVGVLVIALREFRKRRDPAALLLLLIISGYSIRMLLDSNIRDHMLQQFTFLVGVLLVMSVSPRRMGTLRAE